VSFVTDTIDIGVCPGFWIKKNGKVHSRDLQSLHIGYATLSQKHQAFMMTPSQMAF